VAFFLGHPVQLTAAAAAQNAGLGSLKLTGRCLSSSYFV